MSKKKSLSMANSAAKRTGANVTSMWPTRAQIEQRSLEKKASKGVAKQKETTKQLEKLMMIDAATRLPMPTSSALSNEIRAAHAAPKQSMTAEEAAIAKVVYAEGNDAWTQVETLAAKLAYMLKAPLTITPFISGEPLKYIPEAGTLAKVVRLLSSDTAEFVRMCNAVYAVHQGKTGSALTEEDQNLSREVFSRYINIFELYCSVVLPVFDHFTMLVQTGITLMEMEHPEAARKLSDAIKESAREFQVTMSSFATAYSVPEFVLKSEQEAAEQAIIDKAKAAADKVAVPQ